MSNLVSSNAPGKKCKEVTCCAKCTFFHKKEKKKCPQGAAVLLHPIQCTCSQRCNGESKKGGNAACVWIICCNQGFLNLAVMLSSQS